MPEAVRIHQTARVVAVGGPGDGRRYEVTESTKYLRVFKDGPLRGNPVPKGIHLLEGTFTEYDLAEFGVVGEPSIVILKPVGSTLVNIMGNLAGAYCGMKIPGTIDAQAVAITHVVGLLRRTRDHINDVDMTQALNKFFDAYDDETSEAISQPGAMR